LEARTVLETIEGHDIPAKTLHAFRCIIEAGLAVEKAQTGVACAIHQVAGALDALTDAVRDRSREMFLDSVKARAAHCTTSPFLRGECLYCCEPVLGGEAAWMRSEQCRHEPAISCKPCIVTALYEGTDRGRKSFVRCALCRAECTLRDVSFTGAVPLQ